MCYLLLFGSVRLLSEESEPLPQCFDLAVASWVVFYADFVHSAGKLDRNAAANLWPHSGPKKWAAFHFVIMRARFWGQILATKTGPQKCPENPKTDIGKCVSFLGRWCCLAALWCLLQQGIPASRNVHTRRQSPEFGRECAR